MTTHELRTRRRPAHAVHVSARRPTIVFLTVCTAHRRQILAEPAAAAIVISSWVKAAAWLTGKYVIMPDHVHLFCTPIKEHVSLGQWVKYWKALITRDWPTPQQRPVWQVGYWDTTLRSTDGYESKWEYVRCNPVRHGLVASSDAWPYQGELNELWWN